MPLLSIPWWLCYVLCTYVMYYVHKIVDSIAQMKSINKSHRTGIVPTIYIKCQHPLVHFKTCLLVTCCMLTALITDTFFAMSTFILITRDQIVSINQKWSITSLTLQMTLDEMVASHVMSINLQAHYWYTFLRHAHVVTLINTSNKSLLFSMLYAWLANSITPSLAQINIYA